MIYSHTPHFSSSNSTGGASAPEFPSWNSANGVTEPDLPSWNSADEVPKPRIAESELRHRSDGTRIFELELQGICLEAWHDHPAIVQVMVPRFEFSSVVNLRPSLEGLGMVSAFDLASADFTGIEPEGRLFVDTLEHRTTVQVDEEGMTGAAATGEVQAYSPITPQLRFNRPFFFFVYDHATATVLFVGRLVRPAGQARPPTEPPVAQSDAAVICGGLALRCPARTTTEADCLAALSGADPAVVERCADCLLMHFDSYAEGMCEPATCGEFCPTHPF